MRKKQNKKKLSMYRKNKTKNNSKTVACETVSQEKIHGMSDAQENFHGMSDPIFSVGKKKKKKKKKNVIC